MTKKSFHLRPFVVIIILLAITFFVLRSLNMLPNIKGWFTSKYVKIDTTPVLIKEVKNIAQLLTMSSYDEVVVDTTKLTAPSITAPIITMGPKKTRLVIIAKGLLIAGVDLQELDDKKIYLQGDSVSIALPAAKILDAIVNPSQFEIFIEDKGWQPEEVNQLKVSARNRMVQRSIYTGLLTKAREKAKLMMESFLRTTGFKKIYVY
ncbi:MAG: hypothetical protein RL115_1498 [Bacteroidota bacterium]